MWLLFMRQLSCAWDRFCEKNTTFSWNQPTKSVRNTLL